MIRIVAASMHASVTVRGWECCCRRRLSTRRLGQVFLSQHRACLQCTRLRLRLLLAAIRLRGRISACSCLKQRHRLYQPTGAGRL